MGNHVVVEDPNTIKGFIRYLKSESTNFVNKLCGRAGGSIWKPGYDSPVFGFVE